MSLKFNLVIRLEMRNGWKVLSGWWDIGKKILLWMLILLGNGEEVRVVFRVEFRCNLLFYVIWGVE